MLGLEHTSTLDTVNSLGNLYVEQGRLSDAEAMYKRALRGYEKALGPEYVDTYIPAQNTIRNLAVLYTQLRKISDARALYVRCQNGVEALFGVQHERYQEVTRELALLDDC